MSNLYRTSNREKGSVLIIAYFAVAVLAIFSLAMYSRSHVFQEATEKNVNRMVSFNIAEAGVDLVIAQLSELNAAQADNYSRYPCANDYDANNDGINEGCSVAYTTTMSGGTALVGGYEIWVNDPENAVGNYRHIKVAGQTPVNGNATIAGECTGTSSATRGYECRSIEAYVELDDTLLEHAVFAEGDLTFNGTSALVDSYDANAGAYGGGNVGAEGSIGSNGSEATGEIVLNGSPTINGEIKENLGIECDAPVSAAPIGSAGNLSINSETTLPVAINNIYHYDSIDVRSSGGLLHIGPSDPMDPNYGLPVTIYVDGDLSIRAGEIQAHSPVTFYVTGDVNLAGNGVTTSNNTPENLFIYSTGIGSVSVSGGSEFYGVVFAPDSEVDVNGGIDFYGAIFAKEFDGNGAGGIHYDTTLANMKLPCVIVRFRSWEETNRLMGS